MNISELMEAAGRGALNEWVDERKQERRLTPVGLVYRNGSILVGETLYPNFAAYRAAMDAEYPGLPGVLIVAGATE